MTAERESKKKRFGTIAIEMGYITQEDVMDALKTQLDEDLKDGKHRVIGVILYEKGILDAVQIKNILDSMMRASSVAT
ncbi:MAG: hypothetical protein ABIJ31_06445 [Pseudomonadota bacterium]